MKQVFSFLIAFALLFSIIPFPALAHQVYSYDIGYEDGFEDGAEAKEREIEREKVEARKAAEKEIDDFFTNVCLLILACCGIKILWGIISIIFDAIREKYFD